MVEWLIENNAIDINIEDNITVATIAMYAGRSKKGSKTLKWLKDKGAMMIVGDGPKFFLEQIDDDYYYNNRVCSQRERE